MIKPPSRLVLIRAAAIAGYPHAIAAGLLLFTSSCATQQAMTQRAPASRGVQHADVSEQHATDRTVVALSHNVDEQNVNGASQDPFLNCSQSSCETTSCETMNLSTVEQTGQFQIPAEPHLHPQPQPQYIQRVAGEFPAPNAEYRQPYADSQPLVCDPRQPLDHPAFCSTNTHQDMGVAIVRKFPEYVGDEYVCDGGDRRLPVHYNGSVRMGLDTEDTVAEYIDHTGEQHVKPSTKACIYAPRFAAVRSTSLPQMEYNIDRALGHQDDRRLAGLDTKLVIDEKVQRDEARGMLMRSRPSGIEGKAFDGAMNQVVAAGSHIKLLNAYQDIQFFRDGLYEQANAAIIDRAIQAAIEWADDQHLRIYAHDQAGQQVQARFTAQDMTAYEDRRKVGDLQIIKVADKQAAHPGDEVTFTIRFDNTGDRELLGVRIVDNLSPRLEFIEGSIESDFDGDIKIEENGAGGQLLTFEFANQLPGKSGASVSFKCRVR